MILSGAIKGAAQTISDDGWTMLSELFGLTDGINVKGSRALREVTVFTCIRILSEAIAKVPLRIYQDNGEVRRDTKHYLNRLLRSRPNPYMTSFDYFQCLEVQRNIYGNSYAWPDVITTGRNAGKIAGIYPLDSQKVQIYVDDCGLVSTKNSVWYIFTDNVGKQYKIFSDNILHFKGMTKNGIVGISTVEQLQDTIESAKSAQTFLNNSFKNGMQTAGIIQYIGELDEKAKTVFRENFESMSSGLKNANRVSLLPVGYQYQPTALKLTDAQFIENSKLTVQQITAAFGVKLHQLNELEKGASYATTSEANREFYSDTLMAILTIYELEHSYKLYLDSEIDDGYYMEFDVDRILRASMETRFEAYGSAVQNAIKTPNEIRALENDPPKSGGDRLYMNGNYIPAEMAGEQYKKGAGANGK